MFPRPLCIASENKESELENKINSMEGYFEEEVENGLGMGSDSNWIAVGVV